MKRTEERVFVLAVALFCVPGTLYAGWLLWPAVAHSLTSGVLQSMPVGALLLLCGFVSPVTTLCGAILFVWGACRTPRNALHIPVGGMCLASSATGAYLFLKYTLLIGQHF